MNNQEIIAAREKYRPKQINVLFIAEAPPCTEGQFFYFENVTKHDNLFLYIIRAVFPDLEKLEVKDIRARKQELLERFKNAGFFLEDSVFESIPKGTTNGQKKNLILTEQEALLNRISQYKDSAIVLLSTLVFNCNYEFLKSKGFTILNNTPIPFPGNGQQNKFKEEMTKLVF